ncbi:MAG TPA: carbon-nitrogen hydrolase family protein [Nocardia sp.]|uniref:carbon-nitrogen hydrolase family protein n=1 Tax=Nocardia sp. TaxID=1821 RepID=UPI002B4AC0F2|nr:carbon-nitrogen hydrolase family protein [Nocardia sp.]HLS75321.1 carbon-nitrogen hydrolase family protein [Nocardia sp.]
MATTTVALVQAGGMTDDLAGNLAALSELITAAAAPDASGAVPDLIVLPELCTTPYFCGGDGADRADWAQPVPGPTTGTIGALARELGCAIAFGMFERSPEGAFHNSVVVLGTDGQPVRWDGADGSTPPAYRKLSLPRSVVGGVSIDEQRYFSPGSVPATVELGGVRFGCVICYDRSFPEYWAVARTLGATVMLAVVSSLGTRETLFLAELQTRALESQMWVVAVNRGGPETLDGSTVDYFGLSCVIAPDGTIVAQAPAHRTGPVLRCTLDLDAVTAARTGLPLGRDRRPDVLRLLADLTAPTADDPGRAA